MAPLTEVLSSYVPLVVQRRFEQDPRPLHAPEVHRYRGSLLFLDISGFTALTESLAAQGPTGTEKLTGILNGYFDRVITTITNHGGDVVKLAGDSVIAMWEADADFGVAGAAMRAAECGLAARASAAVPETNGHSLELRAAVAAGDIGAMFLGGDSDRWELLLVGDAMVQIAAAARAASPGEVVASHQAWQFLEGRFTGRAISDHAVEVLAVARKLDAKPQPAPILRVEAHQALLTYLPEGVKARLLAGHSSWLAELRRVSVVFVNLPDWDQSALAQIKRTQLVMSSLQKTVYQHEGSINKLAVDDKGVTMLVVLGLPPFAHEDDAARAVRCALAVQSQLRELSVRSAIGVATGRVYCGLVGSDRRREYTVIGSTVNLAARLMQAAPGDVLCDEPTQAAARADIRFEPLPPIVVKGRTQPLPVFRPFSRAISDAVDRPMFGRVAERSALTARLDALGIGARATVVIEAEEGMGKSRLIAELRREAAARAIATFVAAGSSIERTSPYHAWRPVFGQLFGVGDGIVSFDLESARRAALERLSEPELVRLAPLLNAVLPLELADNELTAQMTGGTRAENTHEALLRILDAEARRAPMLIVLEDVHWMDSASLAFAAFAARRLQPALFVATTRPVVEPRPEQRELFALADSCHKLDALSDDDTARLVADSLGVARVPVHVQRLVASRAQGHPFFSEQLAVALRDTGVIRIEGGECVVPPEIDLDAVTLPASIELAVTGRMDRLSPGQQLTLKVASVIGRVFAFRILRDVHPIEPDRPRLTEYLNGVTQSDLAALERPEPDLVYAFKHAITQEVAYNLMVSTYRKQLHKAVADWYVSTFASDLRPHYTVIAYHYKHAGERAPALQFADLAGQQSMRDGAYREAIGFVTDALVFDAELKGPDVLRRARWESALADAYIGVGDVRNSRVHAGHALALLGAPAPSTRATQLIGIASQAAVQLAHARRPAAFQQSAREARERSEAAALAWERLGHLCYFDADLPLGLYAAIRCVNLAERSGAPAALGRAYADMAMASMVLGFRRASERYCGNAEALIDRIDDRAARAWIHQVAGVYGSSMGQFARAERHLQQAIAIADSVRDFRRQEESTFQYTLVKYQSARFDEALQLAEAVRELSAHHGHRQEHLWSTQLVALCLTRLGRIDEASDTAQFVTPEQIEGMGRTEQIIQYGAQALCHARAGEFERSAKAAEAGVAALRREHPMVSFDLEGTASLVEALTELIAIEREPHRRKPLLDMAALAMPYLRAAARVFIVGRPRYAWLRGVVANLNASHRTATASFEKAIALGASMQMPYEAALAHLHLALQSGDLPEGKTHATTAADAFAHLGAQFDRARAEAAVRA